MRTQRAEVRRIGSAKVAAAIMIGALAAGCAGRTANPVSAYSPHDQVMDCVQIGAEIDRNNKYMLQLGRESIATEHKNIAVGAVSLLLFWPAAFAMDFKGAADTDLQARDERNKVLTGLAAQKGCRVPQPMTMSAALDAGAEGMREEAEANEADHARRQGATGGGAWDGSTAYPAPAPATKSMPAPVVAPVMAPVMAPAAPTAVSSTAPAAPSAAASPAVGLEDLMRRFLAGEMDQAEYLRQRAALR